MRWRSAQMMNETKTVLTARAALLWRWVVVCGGLLLSTSSLASVGFAQLNHIQTAAQLLSRGQTAEAEHEARQALGDPSTRALALAMLGTIRLQEGKYSESILFLNKALELNPHLSGTWTTLGDAYVLQNEPDLARQSFEKALKLNPSNMPARYDLAKLEASLRDYQKSLEIARPILAQLRKSDDGLLILAEDYGSLKEKQELIGVIHDWQDLPAHSDESSLEFAQLLMSYGMTSEAKGVVEAIDVRSEGHATWQLAWNLGKAYLALGELEPAERNFQLAVSLNPSCAPCDQGVAEVSEQQGNSEKALAYLLKAKQLKPDDPEILFEFGKICLKRNLVEDALTSLGKAASLAPDDDRYVYVFGSANVARGNLPKAASLFESLLRKHPDDPVLNYAVGTVYYLQGKYNDAESSLKRSLQEQPNQVAAAYYLSLTYSHLGQNDQAEALLRGLVKSHPQYAPSYVKLGTILAAEHHDAEAEENLERAISLDPGSEQAHYQLYLLFRALRKPTEAKLHFDEWQKIQKERSARDHLEFHLLLPD